MTQSTRQARPTEPGQNQRAAAPERAKKAYRKPQLAKYDQLHGIGLGS
jgi:hypothetical protein